MMCVVTGRVVGRDVLREVYDHKLAGSSPLIVSAILAALVHSTWLDVTMQVPCLSGIAIIYAFRHTFIYVTWRI